jgi:hypothetical protein
VRKRTKLQPIKPILASIEDSAVIIGGTTTRVRELLREGRITAVKDGPQRTLVVVASLERHVESLPVAVFTPLPAKNADADYSAKRNHASDLTGSDDADRDDADELLAAVSGRAET